MDTLPFVGVGKLVGHGNDVPLRQICVSPQVVFPIHPQSPSKVKSVDSKSRAVTNKTRRLSRLTTLLCSRLRNLSPSENALWDWKPWRFIGLIGLCFLLATPTASAEPLRVATNSFPPFVFVGSQTTPLRGYSIELWDRIATRLDEDYEFVVFDTVAEVLEAVEEREVEAAIAGITITAEREARLDFTHYYYESGLQILILDQPDNPLFSALGFVFSRSMLEAVSFLLGVALISAHLLWFFERHQNPEMFPKAYLRGIWEALWWSFVTATTVGYGDKAPKGFVGRLVAIVWMFAGIFVMAYFTAAITTNRLAVNIVRLEDLYGRRVGAVAQTTADNYLRQQPLKLIEFNNAEQSYQALREGEVRAVVNDAPTLLYRASQEEDLRVVGSLFAQQDYGIAVPQGSQYRDRINRILLQLKETGELDDLKQKWFPPSN